MSSIKQTVRALALSSLRRSPKGRNSARFTSFLVVMAGMPLKSVGSLTTGCMITRSASAVSDALVMMSDLPMPGSPLTSNLRLLRMDVASSFFSCFGCIVLFCLGCGHPRLGLVEDELSFGCCL